MIQLIDKSMDWFLYDNGLLHERVKRNFVDDLLKAQQHISNIFLMYLLFPLKIHAHEGYLCNTRINIFRIYLPGGYNL